MPAVAVNPPPLRLIFTSTTSMSSSWNRHAVPRPLNWLLPVKLRSCKWTTGILAKNILTKAFMGEGGEVRTWRPSTLPALGASALSWAIPSPIFKRWPGMVGQSRYICSLFLGLFCSIRLIPHAVKPMNKTGEIGLFFFFIHILVCFWLKYSSKAYPWMRMLNVEREGAGRVISSRIKMTNHRLKREIVNSLWRTDRSSSSQHKFFSNRAGVNYSILLGQCAPLLGVHGGLDGTE